MVLPRPTSSARMAPRESGLQKAKKCRLDLMRIEIDLSIRQYRRQFFNAVGSTTPR